MIIGPYDNWTGAVTNATAYTITTSGTSTYPIGQLVLADPVPRQPATEVERLFGEVEEICALAR